MKKSEIINIINNQYPNYIIKFILSLGSGYDSEAYLVNDEYVFKFPKHQKAANNLYKEAHVLLEIKDKLPITVPGIKFMGKSSKRNSMDFVGYEKIEGCALTQEIFNSLDEKTKDEMVKELANFFKVLHSIKLKTDIDGLEIDKKDKCIKEYNIIKEFAFPMLDIQIKEKIDKLYEGILNNDFDYKRSLVHNDFGVSNIFFDTNTNKICGIIDFGDVAIYDQDIDFICLLQNNEEGLDRNFVLKILEYYNHSDIHSVIKKSEFNEFYSQLELIVLGKEFRIDSLFKESIEKIKKDIIGYKENIIEQRNYNYYI